MKYSKEEVLQYVEQENVKFIRLAFCDVYGRLKNIAIQPSELKNAFDRGIAFDPSAIEGFGEGTGTGLCLKPDPATLSELPWRPRDGRVVRMYCDVAYPDGTPFECDSREILKKAVEEASKQGISFEFGSYMEFYLFRTGEDGEKTDEPYDYAGYMDVAPEDKGENVRREICLALDEMGIFPVSSHHEEGPGQNEIDFRSADPLTAADNAVTFKTVVSSIASGNGLYADFSPKPIADRPGSGFHVHFKVKSEGGENVLPFAMAGILEKIKEMTLFLNPVADSYKRLGGYKAPAYITWAKGSRSQLIRVPAEYPDTFEAELRSPDPSANPYVVFAFMIYAGLYGIRNRLPLQECTDKDLSNAEKKELKDFTRLPEYRKEAVNLAEASGFIRECLPGAFADTYF